MPEGIPYASSNVVAGAGLDLNYIGNLVFGYSGIVVVQSAPISLLEAQTGSGTIECKVGIFTPLSSSNNAEIVVKLNDISIVAFEVLNTTQGDYLTGFAPIDLIIPPYTQLKITAVNTASSAEMQWCASLVGKVHK